MKKLFMTIALVGCLSVSISAQGMSECMFNYDMDIIECDLYFYLGYGSWYECAADAGLNFQECMDEVMNPTEPPPIGSLKYDLSKPYEKVDSLLLT